MPDQGNSPALNFERLNITLNPEHAALLRDAVLTLYGKQYAAQLTSRDRNTFTKIIIKAAAQAVIDGCSRPSLPLRLTLDTPAAAPCEPARFSLN